MKRQVLRKRMQIVSLLFDGDVDRAAVEMQSTVLKKMNSRTAKNLFKWAWPKYRDFYKSGSKRPGSGKRITKA